MRVDGSCVVTRGEEKLPHGIRYQNWNDRFISQGVMRLPTLKICIAKTTYINRI